MNAPLSIPMRQDQRQRLLDAGIFVLVILSAGVALSKNVADPDIWGHVQYARDAMRDGLPSTATYSYTAAGHPWINHEVISEYLLASGLDNLGAPTLLTLKCLAGIILLLSIHRRAVRSGVTQWVSYFVLLLAACCLMHFWSLRPQLISYLFFAVMIALLDRCWPSVRAQADSASEADESNPSPIRHSGWLWSLPLLFCIWANSHGGFVAGWCILVAYAGCRAIEHRNDGRLRYRTVVQAGLLPLVCLIATLLNPYGVNLHRWLIASLSVSRPEIVEWRAPELLSVVWPTWWLLVVLFILTVCGTRKRRNWTHLLILSVTLCQACLHRRHIPFFVILLGYWMPVHIESFFSRLRGQSGRQSSDGERRPGAVWAMIAGVVAAGLVVGVQLYHQLTLFAVRVDGYPVAAFQFMADQELHGRLVTRFKWAQYAVASFGPSGGTELAFDGRFRTCYPQEIVDLYFDFADGDLGPGRRYRSEASPPIRGDRILEYGKPDLVLIDRGQPNPVRIMKENRDRWVLLYQDGLAQLWGRATRYDDPGLASYVPLNQRELSNRPQSGAVPWPALPIRPESAASAGPSFRRHATVSRSSPGRFSLCDQESPGSPLPGHHWSFTSDYNTAPALECRNLGD